MVEYIERENLLSEIHNNKLMAREPAAKRIIETIELLPAADARPERHGEWVERTDGGEGFVCRHCNGGYTVYDETPYCPNCGAKMDGKDGESDVHTMQ